MVQIASISEPASAGPGRAAQCATRGRLRNRIAGGMLIGAGPVLAAARHK
jgi:hypothetical protein